MVGNNALLSLMNKLRNLKNQIRIWNKSNSGTRKNDQLRLKKQLEEIDLDIDRGLGNERADSEASDHMEREVSMMKLVMVRECRCKKKENTTSAFFSELDFENAKTRPTDEFQFGRGLKQGSGYQQKDRKPSQNDKTEHGMEKTVQNQGQSPKMSKSESILKNQQSNRSRN
ncbi:hypothetical protein Tco_1319057 [Tanacetum coccineum]